MRIDRALVPSRWAPARYTGSWLKRVVTVGTVCAVVSGALSAEASDEPPEETRSPAPGSAAEPDQPPGGATNRALADSALQDLLLGPPRRAGGPLQAGPNLELREGTVVVELHPSGSEAAVRRLVSDVGGTVTGSVDGVLVEARVPITALAGLQASEHIAVLAAPSIPPEPGPVDNLPPVPPYGLGSDATTKSRARRWHRAGWTGRGVRVGVVDFFDGKVWARVAGAGELPRTPAGVFCRKTGQACSIWDGNGDVHGAAVAEAILDVSPRAKLYLARVESASDLQAAVNWFASKGVRIISRSMGAPFDGPGNGSISISAHNNVAASAVAKGILFVNSAGNFAGREGERDGGYWRGEWIDSDRDGWRDFANGTEVLKFQCDWNTGLRWSDWAAYAAMTDYDVYVYNPDGTLHASSTNRQQIGYYPIERVPCVKTGEWYKLAIFRHHPGSGSVGDWLEFMNKRPVEVWSNSYSAGQPISDAYVPGVLSVGAVDPPLQRYIAPYSAWGPTNDGRTKPDLVAASNFQSSSYDGGFNGTSAATPIVSGASALVLDAYPSTTPAQLATWLKSYATVDRGSAGADNVYGTGELVLPAPPAGCHGVLATIVGTRGADRIQGSMRRDVIVARGGSDTIHALGGNDLICAGQGHDRVFGQGGRDAMFGGRGNDVVIGGHGRDAMYGGLNRDRCNGQGGRDRASSCELR